MIKVPGQDSSYFGVVLAGSNDAGGAEVKETNFGVIVRSADPTRDVLEIGPGSGPMIPLYLLQRFRAIRLIDRDTGVKAFIEGKYGLHVDVSMDIVASLQALPPDSTSLLVLSHVLEHMSASEARTLLEAAKPLLTSTALVLIELPNIAATFDGIGSFYADFTHRTPYTSASLRQLALSSGYRIVTIRGMHPPYRLTRALSWLKWSMEVAFGWVLNAISSSRVVRNGAFYAVLQKDINSP